MNNGIDMNEKTCTLLEAPWTTLLVDIACREVLESFCNRNRIPYECVLCDLDKAFYSVRDGIDAQDVTSYMLRMTCTPDDEEAHGLIHMLFQLRIYWAPKYEYESHIYRTEEDEWMLSCSDCLPIVIADQRIA